MSNRDIEEASRRADCTWKDCGVPVRVDGVDFMLYGSIAVCQLCGAMIDPALLAWHARAEIGDIRDE